MRPLTVLRIALLLAALASAAAVRAECHGNAECIGVGPTPSDALRAFDTEGGPTTFTLDFGSQPTGTTSAPRTVYVVASQGPAGATATLGAITITGTGASSFFVTGGSCLSSNPVQGGPACTITVAFNPLSTGAKTATLHVPLNPPCHGCIAERFVTLSGTGTAPTPPPPAITSASSAGATVGQPFSYQITATNSPATFGASGLPPGVSVNTASGLVSGTPLSAGVFAATVSATNAGGTGSATLNVTVSPAASPPSINSPTNASGIVGQSFVYQITATNSPTSYSAAPLPPGLSIDAGTGVISGVPAAAGAFPVTLAASNAAGTGSATLSVSIAAQPAPGAPPAITSPNSATATVGQAFVFQVVASNAPTSYAATGLPLGLLIDPATGSISGTPAAAGTFTVALSASNASGTGQAMLSVVVSPPSSTPSAPPSITSARSANAVVGQAFTFQVSASNAPTAFAASGLPQGLAIHAATGLISGVPITAGNYATIVSAVNAFGTGTATLAITVAPDAAPQRAPPVIASASAAAGTVGQPFRYLIIASNQPDSYAATGLPPGIAVNTATGVISGVPAAPGTFAATVSAINLFGMATAQLRITVAPAVPAAPAVPIAAPREATTAFETPVQIDLATSITGTYATLAITADPRHGRVALAGSVATYTPEPGFAGEDGFEYAAGGAAGTSPSARVRVTVTAGNPLAMPAAFEVPLNTAATFDLSRFVRGGIATRILVVTPPAHGQVTAVGSSATYIPAHDYFGPDKFTFAAVGASGVSPAAEVSIAVIGRPDPSRDPAVAGIATSQRDAARRFAAAQVANFQSRLEALHRPADAAFSPGGALAQLPSGSLAGFTGGTDVWLAGNVGFGLARPGGAPDSRFTSDGVSAGIDRRIDERWAAGVGIGAAWDRTRIGDDGSRSHARAGVAAAYASAHAPDGGWFVDGLAGGGALRLESERFIAPVDSFASGHRRGRIAFASIASGYESASSGRVFAPYARVDYTRETLDAFAEEGAAAYSLAFARQSASQVEAALGLRAQVRRATDLGTVTPRLRAEYRHAFQHDRDATIRYADLPDSAPYLSPVPSYGRDAIVLGLGAELAMRTGTRLDVEVNMRHARGESDQSIRLVLSHELGAAGPAATAPAAGGRGLGLQMDVGFALDDNVSRAPDGSQRLSDRSWRMDARKSWSRLLAEHVRLTGGLSLGVEQYERYVGLSRASEGADMELQYRPSAAFFSPTLALFAEVVAEQYDSRLRDGWRDSVGASVRQPITDRLNLFAAIMRNARHARSEVFDTRDRGARLHLDYALAPRHALYASAEYRRGDIVSSADLPHETVHQNPAGIPIAADDAFVHPVQLYAYRVKGRTVLATVGYNYALGPKDAFDISWRRVEATPDSLGTTGLYGDVALSRYLSRQFFILYLLSF